MSARVVIGGTDVTDLIQRCAESAPPLTEHQVTTLRRIFAPSVRAAQQDLAARAGSTPRRRSATLQRAA